MTFQHQAIEVDENGNAKWLNRRATVRYQCAPATVGKVYPGVAEEFVRAYVLDLSKGGAGLLLPRPIDVGQAAVIQISSPDDGHKYEFSGRVAHATQQLSGDWMIGFEFDTRLTVEQLDQLL